MGKYDMTTAKWYGNAVRVPVLRSRPFATFVASSFGIVKSVLRDKLEQNITIRFTRESTASADQENSIINISAAFVEGQFADQQLNGDSTIAALIGVIVHEAAHFAYTPPKALLTAADYVKAKSRYAYSLPLAATLMNVVEDIYIEAEIERVLPNLSWTLEILNGVLFKEEKFQSVFDAFCEITEAPEDFNKAARIISALIWAKTRTSVNSSEYIQNLFDVALLARNLSEFQDRLDLTLSLYNLLMVNVPKREEPEDCTGDAPGSESESREAGEESKGSSGVGEEEGEEKEESKPTSFDDLSSKEKRELKKMLEEVDKVLSNKQEGFKPDNFRPYRNYTASEVERKIEQFERAESHELNLDDDDLSKHCTPTDLFIFHKVEVGEALEVDPRYGELAEVARQRAVVNRPYGIDKTRGHSIRKLYRIATDQKIFAENALSHSYKPMQVAILVDYSGSMTTLSWSPKVGKEESNLIKASRAALGAAIALTEARCDVSVYAHTAQLSSQTSVDIYTVKEFNSPLSNIAEKFGWLTNNTRPYQNRDGYAIACIGKRFTTDTRKKLLIVISDGEPCSSGYQGNEANEHTHRRVNDLRRQGVDVLSISITNAANNVNNFIYGEDHNVYNDDPNVISQIVDRIINQKGN